MVQSTWLRQLDRFADNAEDERYPLSAFYLAAPVRQVCLAVLVDRPANVARPNR
ncbi:MAG: hypothetical protein IPN29_07500 [Saprospiraceae bacterium]|nr:hypothetical protein [Saprospiraceae bacterium]